jgi:hypothetical protein
MPAYSEIADYFSINNFVDLDPAIGSVRDWNCGARTYDKSTPTPYNHRGIDIDLWPFYWNMMDNNYVAVVAAAAGRVVAVTDNLNNESNCGLAGENGTWNHIAIRHADSSTTIYGHLRRNSAQVTVNQQVAAGDVIAFVGSSGSSSNPHLHFEVNTGTVTDSQPNGYIDPYTGLCNLQSPRWVSQKPYWEPAIVRVMTHGSMPRLPGINGNNNTCRSGEVINAKSAFTGNDSIYFGIAIRDFPEAQTFTLSVFDPNGVLWFSESTTNSTSNNEEKWYELSAKKIPAVPTSGTYRAVVDFYGTSATHFFSINCPANQPVPGVILGWQGFKSSNTITSTATINAGNRLLLQAGTKITLTTGFTARNGSIVKARIRDCNYSE